MKKLLLLLLCVPLIFSCGETQEERIKRIAEEEFYSNLADDLGVDELNGLSLELQEKQSRLKIYLISTEFTDVNKAKIKENVESQEGQFNDEIWEEFLDCTFQYMFDKGINSRHDFFSLSESEKKQLGNDAANDCVYLFDLK